MCASCNMATFQFHWYYHIFDVYLPVL